jgi:hypothetical protein
MASSVPGLIAFASMCSKAEAVVDHGEVAGGQFETMAIGVGNHLTAGRRSWSRLGLAASGVEPDSISSCASPRASRTFCASPSIRERPSPITRPNAMAA